MGANIGTSVTNTIVALTQVQEREEFRRAFAAATIHDMFNWLTVLVLLPLEMATGEYSFGSLVWIVSLVELLLDKNVLEGIGNKDYDVSNKSFIKRCCKYNETICIEDCKFLFRNWDLPEAAIGGILCAISIILLTCSLVMMVKVLKSSLKGRVSVFLEKFFTTEKPFPYNILMGYIAILMGCLMTILLQSSSIFTSALTPLAGIGVVPLESMYPLTLGSNLGTTTTSILAAFAAPSAKIKDTLQIAFCHLLFNLSGILLFYPIPYLRFPIGLARALGNLTASYRWFAVLYMVMMFIIFPVFIFALSWAGSEVLAAVLGTLLLLVALIILINVLQRKRPGMLPQVLRTWEWLPECLRSLEPMDRLVSTACCCCKKRNDGTTLRLKANVSQVNIVESAKESHHLEGLENRGFIWARTNGAAESTLL
ncbi:SLC34A2 [Cordylochernes scorpioides]|uniref:SLC34A2 n=1 Tax=Cordylochernes scorpioides TaxID=51811 RepID=A0ABY6K3Z6_9ARAC|nr:SLC34A2 [Cordylochernes scorpioides]